MKAFGHILMMGMLLMSFGSKAQSVIPKERILLTVDRTAAFGGDNIHFAAKVEMRDSNWTPSLSRTLYVDLIDREGAVVSRLKSPIIDGRSAGVVSVGNLTQTGDYLLRAYTRYTSGREVDPQSFIPIRVIRPGLSSSLHPAMPTSSTPCTSDSLVELRRIDSKSLAWQWKPLTSTPVSLRVVFNDLATPPRLGTAIIGQETADTNDLSLASLPDIYGLSMSGLIKDPNPLSQVGGLTVSATVAGAYHQVHFNRTDEDGNFRFTIPHTQGVHEVILCVIGESKDLQILIHDEFNLPHETPIWEPDTMVWNTPSLERALVQHQLTERVFPGHGGLTTSQLAPPPAPLTSPTAHVRLADYVALSSMKQVLNEIVPYCNVRKREGQERIHIFNPVDHRDFETPLLMIDHLPVQDLSSILSLDIKQVESVDLFAEEFIMGGEVIAGCLNINTPNKSATHVNLPDHCRVVEYHTLDESTQETWAPEATSPLGNTLLFKPFVTVAEQHTFTLPQDVHLGDYDVIFTSFDDDGGCRYQQFPLVEP